MRPRLLLAACSALGLLATACAEAPDGDATKVALYDYVPSDAAYAVASGEPFPADLRAKLTELAGAMDAAITASPGISDQEKAAARFWYGFSMASVSGSPLLGIIPDDEWVLYGANLAPRFRMEASEPEKLQAALDSLLGVDGVVAGERDGQRYWQIPVGSTGEVTVVATIDGGIFSAGVATKADEAALLADLVAPPAGDGEAFRQKLGEVRSKHGFTPQLAGFLDLVTFAGALPSTAGNEACLRALEEAATAAPRMAVGYTEVSPARIHSKGVLEVSEQVASDLSQWPVSVPGLGQSEGILSFGFGFDLTKSASAASQIGANPTLAACGAKPQAADPARLAQATGMLTLAGGPRGLNVVLDALPDLQGGQVAGWSGAAVAVLDDPEMALGMMSMLAPEAGMLKLDGEPHDVSLAFGSVQQPIAIAGSGNVLVAALGADRANRARAALAAPAPSEGTVFSMAGAVGDLASYTTNIAAATLANTTDPEVAQQLRLQAQMSEAYAKFFGTTVTSLAFRPEGIVVESEISLR